MNESILLWYSLFCFLVFAIHMLYEHWPRTPEQEYSHLMSKFWDDQRRRGIPVQDSLAELRFRKAFAVLRRRASEAALRQPANAHAIIKRVAKEEAGNLALIDKRTARKFLEVVGGSFDEDIFYADALRAVRKSDKERSERINRWIAKQPVDEDDIASLRIR